MYTFSVVNAHRGSQGSDSIAVGSADASLDARARRSHKLAARIPGSESSATSSMYQRALCTGRTQLSGRFSPEEVMVMVSALGSELTTCELVMDLPDAVGQAVQTNGQGDAASLVEKLRTLTWEATAALLDALERVWDEGHASERTLEDRCERVGLHLAYELSE